MEFISEETEVVWVAAGKTYPIKEELKSLGFRWNQVNKVWYQMRGFTKEQCDFLMTTINDPLWQGVCIRRFEREDNIWRETTYPDSPGPPIPLKDH